MDLLEAPHPPSASGQPPQPPPQPGGDLGSDLPNPDAVLNLPAHQHPPPIPHWHSLHDNPRPQAWAGEEGHSENGSGSEHDESDDEAPPQRLWEPITEDVTVPCADELEFLMSKGEHSALDHGHWEKKAFFEIGDPELVPGASGRIDWLVEGFNGTKDNPNTELLMRSPIVRIGGLDWQIKFYPNGNGSQYLSIYIECISMLEPDFAESEDFQNPPFPFLKGTSHVRKRRSVAAQLSVVMYNPAEPRVYEVQSEAHQFHKKQADYGWIYFSKQPRSEFHTRQHTQRQAILRNDQLAFKAYIRIVDDPTGTMWEHSDLSPEHITSVTGLRPFRKSLQYIAGAVPLLHFAPFRKMIQELPPDTRLAQWLQPLLLKMFTRQRSSTYNERGTAFEGDVLEMMWKVCNQFHSEYEYDAKFAQQWQELVGVFHSDKGAACGANRLNTKAHTSIQDAVNNHPKSIVRPQLLTLELTRQEHDKKARKWCKITNKVRVDDHIQVEGTRYTLFAFITHCGHLMSSRYNSYVRPNGVGKGWYAYQDGLVTRLTEKQAKDRHSGSDPEDKRARSPDEIIQDGYDSPFSEFHEPQSEVPSVVMYVRDDVAGETFNVSAVETWVPPFLRPELTLASLPKLRAAQGELALPDPPPTATHESFTDLERFSPMDGHQQPGESGEAQMAELIQRAAGVATPEPTMDGEDTIMRDVDDESIYSVEALETDPTDGTTLEKGTLSWLGRSHYEGQWKNGRYHGGGYHIDTNGDEYLGKFENGHKHGFGKMIEAASGNVYEGDWVEGRKHGQGTLTELSTGNVFKGGFVENEKRGPFSLTGTVTEEDKSRCTICYDKEMDTAFFDCGHVVACRDCAARIDTCPICRRRIQAKMQLFGVKLSTS